MRAVRARAPTRVPHPRRAPRRANRDRIVELTRTQNAKLAAAIRDGIATGDIRGDLDPDALAAVFLATINGLLALAWRPGALGVTGEELAASQDTGSPEPTSTGRSIQPVKVDALGGS